MRRARLKMTYANVTATLALPTRDQRFGFEAEVIFAARRAGIPIYEEPVRVIYPPRSRHRTHYRAWRDTVHIVLRITGTVMFPIRWLFAAVAAATVLALIAHPTIVFTTRMHPPDVTLPSDAPTVDPRDGDLSWAGPDYARHRGADVAASKRAHSTNRPSDHRQDKSAGALRFQFAIQHCRSGRNCAADRRRPAAIALHRNSGTTRPTARIDKGVSRRSRHRVCAKTDRKLIGL